MRTLPLPRAPVLLLLTAAAAVFALDCFTPLGFSVYMLYAPVCLACLWLGGWRFGFTLGALCSVFVVAGLFFSPPGMPFEWSLVNRIMAMLALWAVLWWGKVFAQRTPEPERTKANLQQEIDQRVQAEQALQLINEELESRVAERTAQLQSALERWELVTRATHDGIYDWDLPTSVVICSLHWKDMHGLSRNDPVSFEHWSERIHPDDRARVLGHLHDYLARRRQEFREEYRIQRHDGSWMWVLDRGIALWNDAGQAVRMVGSEKDITQRKRADNQLRQQKAQLEDLATKLLSAQERERQRIARELHDDFTQRLAVLAVDIGSLEPLCRADMALLPRIQAMRAVAVQLAEDVHNFAYQLHPSLLEHLGLEVAIRDHVDDFSRRTGLAVQYLQRQVPKDTPMDIATCLYRVTQESLQNVSKHAEASNVLVRVLGTPTGVGVCIRDNGKGFSRDPAGILFQGLGLISMEERVHLLKGRFRVRSHPGKGTEVHAWVPLAHSCEGTTEEVPSHIQRIESTRYSSS